MAIKRVVITLEVFFDTERLAAQSVEGLVEPRFSPDDFDYGLNGESRYQPYRVTGCDVSDAVEWPAHFAPEFHGRL